MASTDAAQEQSEQRYLDASRSESLALLESRFEQELSTLDEDPLRSLEPEAVDQYFSNNVARIDPPGPDEARVVVSTQPLRDRSEEGALRPVELELEREGGSFEAENPIADVALPTDLGDPIHLERPNVTIRLQSSGAAQSEAALVDGDRLFFHEAAPDTDVMLAPISNGAELFAQIRSPEAPERLEFKLGLPPDAELRDAGGEGLEVVREDQRIAMIRAPWVVDAKGGEVPFRLVRTDDGFDMIVEHRSAEATYPILADPVYEDWYNNTWVWGSNWNAVNYWQIAGSAYPPIAGGFPWNKGNCWWYCWGQGLYLHAAPSTWYSAGLQAEFSYTAPGQTTYIPYAAFYPVYFARGGDNAWVSPYTYFGIRSATTWSWVQSRGYNVNALSWGGSAAPGAAKYAVFGIASSYGRSSPTPRSAFLGGAMIHLDDPEPPSLGSVPAEDVPTGWLNGTEQPSMSVAASDPGLGVKRVFLSHSGGPQQWDLAQQACGGSQSTGLCPVIVGGEIQWNPTSLAEGQSTLSLTAKDAVDRSSSSTQWLVKVDRTAPEITLADQLAQVTQEAGSTEQPPGNDPGDELSLPTYKLDIDATDGSATQLRSGVKRIELYLDDNPQPEQVPWGDQPCPAGSCAMQQTFQLKLPELEPGTHTLKVIATDQAGNASVPRKIEFEYLPKTGVQDSYVMQYVDLDDGHEPVEGKVPPEPELAVNVTNGNLVYQTRDVEVEGQDVDLELDRFYNSQLPEEENTEWGDGWTLGQTPELEPEQGPGTPGVAELAGPTGSLDSVELPASGESFDPELQATLTDSPGGYELAYEGTDRTLSFDQDGQVEQLNAYNDSSVAYSHGPSGSLDAISTDEVDPEAESAVDVSTAADLVTGVIGDEAGAHTYQHDPQGNLTSHDSAEGETTYSYDQDGRLTGVTLPNGTTATIDYDDPAGRVTEIIHDPAGAGGAQSTTFVYEDDPRNTTVTEHDGLVSKYQIEDDGTILRSTSGSEPPVIDDLGGSIYAHYETGTTLAVDDHNLLISASSGSEVSSIQVLKDGNEQLYEKTCAAETESCGSLNGEWVTSSGAHASGVLDLEVVATDAFGRTNSERFQVTVPVTPPAPADEPVPPDFESVKAFRDQFGLDLGASEETINALVWGLLNAWETGDPQARATAAQWGVPLRPEDIAELQYRELYLQQAATVIPEWAWANAPDTYAGYYVDHQQGGKIYIGFTEDQAGKLAQLESLLAAPPGRVEVFPTPPTRSLDQLDGLMDQIIAYGPAESLVGELSADIFGNRVKVTAADVPTTNSVLSDGFPQGGFVVVQADPTPADKKAAFSRQNASGPIQAGDMLSPQGCTAAFGAWDVVGQKKGKPVISYFVLTAGHCGNSGPADLVAEVGDPVRRGPPGSAKVFGQVARVALKPEKQWTDAAAVWVDPDRAARISNKIYISPTEQWTVRGTVRMWPGQILCQSGRSSGHRCGHVVSNSPHREPFGPDGGLPAHHEWVAEAVFPVTGGDSGGPVWAQYTGKAAGIVNYGDDHPEAPPGACDLRPRR